MKLKFLPTVILCGEPGVGKSSIVTSITGKKGIASSSHYSHTSKSKIYTTNYSFSIYDTPGLNPLKDKFHQNVWVAHAFNSNPISVVLLCVEADTRIDKTMSDVFNMLSKFEKFDKVLCPLITKMDTVEWDENEFRKTYRKETELDNILFFGNQKPSAVLGNEISKIANDNAPLKIKIDAFNFLDFFDIHGNNFKILKKTKELETKFKDAVDGVLKLLKTIPNNERMDLVFQFQNFMFDNIPKMQKELADDCNFILSTNKSAVEYGHLSHLGSKLKSILYTIRHLAAQYTSEHGVSNLRKCPHCGLVWSKVTGCDGETTCGNRYALPTESKSNTFATYSFSLYPFDATRVCDNDLKVISKNLLGTGVGCGKKIVWERMTPVPIPEEILACKFEVSIDDVKTLPEESLKEFEQIYDEKYKFISEQQQ